MKHAKHLRLAKVALAALGMMMVVSITTSAQQSYQLKLGRGLRSFDRYLLKSTFETSTRTKLFISDVLRGDSLDARSVIIAAQCEVVSTTTDGQEKEKRLVIRHFRMITSTDTSELLPTGTKVRCWFSDSGSAFTINDAPASGEVSGILSEVVKGEGGSLTGNILDAKKPVSVGQRWPMNIAALKKVMGKQTSGPMKKLKGTVTFVSIDSTGSMKSALIQARAEDPRYTLTFGEAPSTASIVAEFSVTVPLDTRFPADAVSSSTVQRIVTSSGVARMEFVVSTKRQSIFLR